MIEIKAKIYGFDELLDLVGEESLSSGSGIHANNLRRYKENGSKVISMFGGYIVLPARKVPGPMRDLIGG